MLFAVICTDKPGSLELRQTTRADHLAYLQTHAAGMVQGGPLLDADGRPCGSLLLVEAEDRDAIEAFAADDPYARAGLFADVTIRAYRSVFRDGAQVG